MKRQNHAQPMIDYVKDYIADHIESVIGAFSGTPGDLACNICSYDIDNGTILMDENLSFETLCDWKYESGAFIYRSERTPNPFWRPGLFMAHLVRFGVEDILGQLADEGVVPKDSFRLDRKLAQKILDALDGVEDFTFNR